MSELRDALGTRHAPVTSAPRIVSLVPSLTELLCTLGLAGHLVGRSGFCIHPRASVRHIPKVGGTKEADIEKIRALAPTHLVVNIDENRREQVEAMARFVPHVIVTHPLTPEDNLALYHLFGGIFRREQAAARLAAQFRAAREMLRRSVATLPRERVLYLIWKDPWMTVARTTYISAMLAAAGWDTVPQASTVRYPVLDAVAPELTLADRILLASEPYRFTAKHLAAAAARFRAPAQLIDGESVSWYGSRAIAGLYYLARLRQDDGPAGMLKSSR